MSEPRIVGGLGLEGPVRAFVALPCSEGLRRTIAGKLDEWRGIAADVTWSDAERCHLTLRFLGDADPVRLDRLHRLLEGVAHASEPVLARPSATGAFPGWRRPRVLWLGVESGGSIERLAAAVEAAAREAGFEPEERRFTPHLTLARMRGARGARRAIEAVRGWRPEGPAEPIGEIVLVRSRLGPGGARHSALGRYAIPGRV